MLEALEAPGDAAQRERLRQQFREGLRELEVSETLPSFVDVLDVLREYLELSMARLADYFRKE